jgi:acyl-CoA synthetase (AMP-forming)/AMP-acid ligase II
MTSPRNLYERFESRADTQRVLIREIADEKRLSGRALREEVRRTARALEAEGAVPGDLVLLAGLEGVSLVAGILAVWSRGAVVLAADPQASKPEILALQRVFAPAMILWQSGGRAQAGRAEREEPHRLPLPADAAVIKLSSGSTGNPRGIAVTAAQLLKDTEQLIRGMGIGPEDHNIAVIPLSHSYGMDSILMPLVVQGNPVVMASALPGELERALSIEEPAVFPGIPTLFDLLGRADGPVVNRRGLKTCLSAGALLRVSTARSFRIRHGLPIRAFYGSSETGGITHDASPGGEAAETSEGCVGTPLPGVEVHLEGEEGRIVVRSESVAWGYVGEAGSSADGEFAEGTFRTGDTGRFGEAGRLHLTGRIGGLVNVSGRKVNPREIEEALLILEGVLESAVLGIPDESRGESLLACVVAEEEITRERIMSHLRGRLAAYKLPRRVLLLPELPRTERGKLDRGALLLRAGVSRREKARS